MSSDPGRSPDLPQSPLAAGVGEADARENIRRHSQNLAALADNLRRLGLDEALVDDQVMSVFRQYERELARYVEAAADRRPQE